jgi:predicted GNAT family acetyltransferase
MAHKATEMVTLTGGEQDAADLRGEGAATAELQDLVISDNSDQGVYEATIEGQTVAGLVYDTAGNRVTLMATSVLPEFRGMGVAGRLVGGVLDKLRTEGRTATVVCPFTASFVNAHPEYADVLDPAHPGAHISRHGDVH